MIRTWNTSRGSYICISTVSGTERQTTPISVRQSSRVASHVWPGYDSVRPPRSSWLPDPVFGKSLNPCLYCDLTLNFMKSDSLVTRGNVLVRGVLDYDVHGALRRLCDRDSRESPSDTDRESVFVETTKRIDKYREHLNRSRNVERLSKGMRLTKNLSDTEFSRNGCPPLPRTKSFT